MDNKRYTVEFSYKALKELKTILNDLPKKKMGQKLINSIENKAQILEYAPKLYPKIEKSDELGRNFRKIVLNKYILLYTADENKKKIYLSHIFYKKSNY